MYNRLCSNRWKAKHNAELILLKSIWSQNWPSPCLFCSSSGHTFLLNFDIYVVLCVQNHTKLIITRSLKTSLYPFLQFFNSCPVLCLKKQLRLKLFISSAWIWAEGWIWGDVGWSLCHRSSVFKLIFHKLTTFFFFNNVYVLRGIFFLWYEPFKPYTYN